MEFVRFFVVVLVLCSVTQSNAETSTTPPSSGGAGAGGGDAHNMPCIQKLMPCQTFLHSVNPPPPPSCCLPLKEIVETDVKCLCSVFNNIDMLKSLNLTKENALVLPKACGANADVSQCKASSGTTPPSSSTSPTPPASSTGTGNSSTGDDSASSTAKTSNSAQVMNFAGFSFASAIISTLFF